RFIGEVEHLAGLTVWEANPKIVDLLRSRGALVAEVALDHTYPHCWRCKNPTLFRATEQWFVGLDEQGLRARTLDAIRRDVRGVPARERLFVGLDEQGLGARPLDAIRRDVRWIPAWGEERIFNMIAHRPDW